MHNRILRRSVLFLLITTFIALTLQLQNDSQDTKSQTYSSDSASVASQRFKRATRKPGFFKTLFSVIYEQWSDTRNTVGTVNRLINDNFLPENAPKIPSTTPPADPNESTTTPPYKITRSEFNKILRRNLKGLIRLYNIELQDALKQSDKNYADFRKNASSEVSKFL